MEDFSNALLDAQRDFSMNNDIQWKMDRLGRFTSSEMYKLMGGGKSNGGLPYKNRAEVDEIARNNGINPSNYKRKEDLIEAILKVVDYGYSWTKTAETYIYSKIAERLTGVPPEDVNSRATEWGTDHEDEAIDFFEKKTKIVVRRLAKVFVQWGDYSGGSSDGYIDEDGIIEVKCPYNSTNHIKVLISQEMPEEHFFQCQSNLLFSGRKYCKYISYDPRMPEQLRMVVMHVERDDKVCNDIAEKITLAIDKMNEILKEKGLVI